MLQDYELCHAMCDKMNAVKGSENWWLRRVLRLQAAAAFMKGDQALALEKMRRAQTALDRSPFSGAEEKEKSDKELLAAIQNNNMNFVRDCRNWVDELDKWDDPYETDEAGWHGRKDIPTPYPKTWKTDKMQFTELTVER